MANHLPQNKTEEVDIDFGFDNTFASQLTEFAVPCNAESVPEPSLIKVNRKLAKELGLSVDALESAQGTEIFAGNKVPIGAAPLAQAYAGHQFGNFSPQLGDGRALLLGEIVNVHGHRYDVQLKGSGRTPFSRGGDGKAALGPVLREYLVSEAMNALGVPTTRALAAVTTGEPVYREVPIPGAVLTRTASSHLRIGTFQFFAARQNRDMVKKLADYAISRHYPDVQESSNVYLGFFKAVAKAQAMLVAHWMSIGFIHGVMNTDNTSISGETIDYGPCAFMDRYDPTTVFSSIDLHGRYAYAKQPSILSWNLARFAETLIPLTATDEDQAIKLLTSAIEEASSQCKREWDRRMCAKIGLNSDHKENTNIVRNLLELMQEGKADFTNTFRHLSDTLRNGKGSARKQFRDPTAFDRWEKHWIKQVEKGPISMGICANQMDQINPAYIPRNHKVEEVLSAAINNSDFGLFEDMLTLLSTPFDETEGHEKFAMPAPASSTPYKTFCGT
ncbi:MAG: YdiU family protein [Pseudomonadota bacterium]|nr:YdiU family protein [Pseudomonadota bacterium]